VPRCTSHHLRPPSAPRHHQTTLLLPADATASGGRIVLQADPFGVSAPILTPALLVAPGEEVYWTIGADRAGSYASVG